MRRVEPEVVPLPKSCFSTSATFRPRSAASRAMPHPMMPPPMTTTSKMGSPVGDPSTVWISSFTYSTKGMPKKSVTRPDARKPWRS